MTKRLLSLGVTTALLGALLVTLLAPTTGCLGGCYGELVKTSISPSEDCLQTQVAVCNEGSADYTVTIANNCADSLVLDDAGTDGGTETIAAGETVDVFGQPSWLVSIDGKKVSSPDKAPSPSGGVYHDEVHGKLGDKDVTINIDTRSKE